jgi:hypothetical protein
MLITNISQLSGKETTMELDVTYEQMERFENRKQNGEYVQTIFPNLTPAEREFILSGISPMEWEQMFGNPFGNPE